MRANVLALLLLQLQVSLSRVTRSARSERQERPYNVGTCKDNCHNKGGPDVTYDTAPNCYCDTGCTSNGDCCLDFAAVCTGDVLVPTGTCQDGANTRCGKNPRGPRADCYCDEYCERRRDCCTDFATVCAATNFPSNPLQPTAPPEASVIAPFCRDSTDCTNTTILPHGPCYLYGAGQRNELHCSTDNVHSACPETCGDSLTWRSDYGDCSSYSKSFCAALALENIECNHLYCSDDDATPHCPIACGVCQAFPLVQDFSKLLQVVS